MYFATFNNGVRCVMIKKRSKLVYGVGVNDADYNVYETENVDGKRKNIWMCPFYVTWTSMLVRCYSEKLHARLPTYKDCTVCDEWLIFSNFKTWMEKQNWEGKALDKDLLVPNNKIYSPEYCVFIDSKINNFILDTKASRGLYLLGVTWEKSRNKFKAQCSNPFTGKSENLGRFENEYQAHLAWKARKHELACQLADSEYCNDPRLAEALHTRYL